METGEWYHAENSLKASSRWARTRLGAQVMRQLAERELRLLAAAGAPGACYRGLRAMALDDTCYEATSRAL